MNLKYAQEGKEYIVKRIETDDEELNAVSKIFAELMEDVDIEILYD